jgi:internalin A
MNLSKAKKIVTIAVENNAARLNLSFSQGDSEKLSDNDLAVLLPDILKLKWLRFFDLSSNHLTAFDKEFAKLRNLEELILKNNNLITFDKEFAKLQYLGKLHLAGNKLTTFDREFTKLRNLQELILKNNPLPFPAEILDDYKNPRKILNFLVEYFDAQEKGIRFQPINEAKLVVVGEANVGKTSIINRLIHNKFVKLNSTHGIEIHRWTDVELENKQKVQLNVWDFGGQEIMHSTHQFFFTKRTIYLLVINARENQENNKTEEWLQRIKKFSED